MTGRSLFHEVVAVTEHYLGPSANRFITRQIAFHLHKSPEALNISDIPELCEWTKLTLALLTNDKAIVDDYAAKIMILGRA